MKRLAMVLVPILTVGALTVASHAGDREAKGKGIHHEHGIRHGHGGHGDVREAKIKGKGIADMRATADDTEYGVFAEGDLFVDNDFAIKGDVHADGSATGNATFRFGEEFSNPWGADVITLKCEITTGTAYEDGTIVLQGTSLEEDFVDGVVTFEELSPFEIVLDPTGLFTLRWCKLPALDLEITKGHIKVQ